MDIAEKAAGRLAIGAFAIALALPWPAGAADTMDPLRGPAASRGDGPLKAGVIVSADPTAYLAKQDLIGDSVVSRDGVELGKVSDVILDREGKLSGIVVSAGGVFGIGAKSIGLATSILDMQEAKRGETVLVDLSAQEFKDAPVMRMAPGK
jgi:sporulation protein YlmC with PRC-barrel domain